MGNVNERNGLMNISERLKYEYSLPHQVGVTR